MKTQPQLPKDHTERMQRALLSLDGLSVGDGFGECFFTRESIIRRRLKHRTAPPSPWIVTDDTVMALSIVRCLKEHGHIDQNALAAGFASEYRQNPRRGYGRMAHEILHAISQGVSWKATARAAFGGEGSMGNGGAMRAAPIGAYFADDYERVVHQAKLSAEITHNHPDGKTGAAAVALAAAWMVQEKPNVASHALIEFVLERMPQTETWQCLQKALGVPLHTPPYAAAAMLGNGSRVIASDTVPFCLWCAARHPDNYPEALWATVSGLGDCDTTCAIVGGIVASNTGREGIPEGWLKSREPIKV